MTTTFELTSTYVIAAGAAATTHAAGDAFWRRLAERDPDLAPADGEWLVSSFELVKSWPNWEQHPHGDEIVHCSSGQCTLLLQTPEGVEAVRLSQGKTVVIPRGTWHTARVSTRAQLLHVTSGAGTTFKPAQDLGE
jgi:mannose-6-phosphate isomerase-like protein (cupin superfamily)